MRWYRRHRPKVHWWFWFAIMVCNIGLAFLFAWASRHVEQSLVRPIVGHIVIAIISYFCIGYWQKWIDNPEEYEKLQQARLRGLRGRLVGRGSRKKKKDPPKR